MIVAVDTAGNRLSTVNFLDCPVALLVTSKKSVLATEVFARVPKSVIFAILFFYISKPLIPSILNLPLLPLLDGGIDFTFLITFSSTILQSTQNLATNVLNLSK